GNRKLTASKKIRRLTGDCRQVRFGQGVQQTILFKSTQYRLHTIFPRQPLHATAGDVLGYAGRKSRYVRDGAARVWKEWSNKSPTCGANREGKFTEGREGETAGVHESTEVDSKLLDNVAFHLHYGDLE